MNNRELFFRHLGQTSLAPLGIEVSRAEGIYLYTPEGKRFMDLISGVSVSNVGHCHPKVVEAVQMQAGRYMHLMVYGEIIQSPQVLLAKALTEILPEKLNCVYFVNSGSESIEGAIKLAKRATGRPNMVSCRKSYHGGTHGALSLMGDETMKFRYRPLLPGIRQIDFNSFEQLNAIDKTTACVVIEPIQAEAGIIIPEAQYLQQLRKQCDETGTLLIFDEVQTGFGRTGKLFAFEHFGVVPDILCLAKGMGGGMPIGAFVANKGIMDLFADNPPLGHITTFGGHPVSCAAALASLEIILENNLAEKANQLGQLFVENLTSAKIKNLRGIGLFIAVELNQNINVFEFIKTALEYGLILDPFLFCENAFRIAPPLTITTDQALEASGCINRLLEIKES